jgi:NADPH:quinone reductase-like Zn-dependent oxidoreductase
VNSVDRVNMNEAGPVEQLPRTMAAVSQDRYGEVAADVLEVTEVPVPRPGRGEVLLRVRAAGVDAGTWHLMAGLPLMVRPVLGMRRPRQPIPGRDVAGTVVALGESVDTLAVGDEVFGVGGGTFAEYAVAPAAKLVARPSSMAPEAAAALSISGLTALQAVRDHARVEPGERVLVIGASGGVGSYLLQVLRAKGAHVTAVCRGERADVVRRLGADDVIDRTSEVWWRRDERWDVILDGGGNTSLRTLRRRLTEHGRLVIVGGEGGGRLIGGIDRQVRAALWSPFVGQSMKFFVAKEDGADIAMLRQMVIAGQVNPLVERTWPLAEAAAAVDHLASGSVVGKAVVTV